MSNIGSRYNVLERHYRPCLEWVRHKKEGILLHIDFYTSLFLTSFLTFFICLQVIILVIRFFVFFFTPYTFFSGSCKDHLKLTKKIIALLTVLIV